MASTSDALEESRITKRRQTIKSYYALNRARILGKQREANAIKVDCPCGAKIGFSRRAVHEASDKHQRYLQSKREIQAVMDRVREERLVMSQQLVQAAASLRIPAI
jgi:hypothetical protein